MSARALPGSRTAAVVAEDGVGLEAVELEELKRLRVVARRDLHVVAALPQDAISGRNTSTCALAVIRPHRTNRYFVRAGAAGGVLLRRSVDVQRGGAALCETFIADLRGCCRATLYGIVKLTVRPPVFQAKS